MKILDFVLVVFFTLCGFQVAGCASNSLPSARPRRDPTHYRDHLIAFAAHELRVVVQREIDGHDTLVELDGAKGRAKEITESALNGPNYRPARALQADVINVPFGIIRFTGHEVQARRQGSSHPLILRSVGAQGQPSRWCWFSSFDDTRIAIELHYDDGPVPSSTVWAFELAAIHAKLVAEEVFAGVRR